MLVLVCSARRLQGSGRSDDFAARENGCHAGLTKSGRASNNWRGLKFVLPSCPAGSGKDGMAGFDRDREKKWLLPGNLHFSWLAFSIIRLLCRVSFHFALPESQFLHRNASHLLPITGHVLVCFGEHPLYCWRCCNSGEEHILASAGFRMTAKFPMSRIPGSSFLSREIPRVFERLATPRWSLGIAHCLVIRFGHWALVRGCGNRGRVLDHRACVRAGPLTEGRI